ncbi:uncharacterized protein LDX57_010267 [Aspergillus melleus]|uniref:uncharacterized protein n=1 Tax=Aspergillus melleus TaxID=138277 RepID=UPI001E8EE370|nr:uncharacterized protein LDX57_010267 [Aspergillus melleus]KAH8432640.1 hypothetical protein LDX57_010267 [Aspergillus melleus]
MRRQFLPEASTLHFSCGSTPSVLLLPSHLQLLFPGSSEDLPSHRLSFYQPAFAIHLVIYSGTANCHPCTPQLGCQPWHSQAIQYAAPKKIPPKLEPELPEAVLWNRFLVFTVFFFCFHSHQRTTTSHEDFKLMNQSMAHQSIDQSSANKNGPKTAYEYDSNGVGVLSGLYM